MKAKVLSLRHPWAELVVIGKKTVELRKWNTNYRGEFYIHASKTIDYEACKKCGINPEKLIVGAIIGKAELVDSKKYSTKKELIKDEGKHYASNYEVPCNGFILKNAERINPIKFKGSLGLRLLSF